MKKILLYSLFFFCFSLIASAENKQSDNFVVEITNIEKTVKGTYAIELLVKANEAVDQACDWFNGSWADVGLTVYCTFNKASYVCTAYKIVKGACHVNGAVKLMIEGDWNNAIKQSVIQASKIYKFTKHNSKEYEISEERNYSPVNW